MPATFPSAGRSLTNTEVWILDEGVSRPGSAIPKCARRFNSGGAFGRSWSVGRHSRTNGNHAGREIGTTGRANQKVNLCPVQSMPCSRQIFVKCSWPLVLTFGPNRSTGKDSRVKWCIPLTLHKQLLDGVRGNVFQPVEPVE